MRVVASACGGNLLATFNGSRLTSPNFPGNYPNSLDCVWHIRAEPGFQVFLDVHSIRTETHPLCNYDRLTLYAGT